MKETKRDTKILNGLGSGLFSGEWLEGLIEEDIRDKESIPRHDDGPNDAGRNVRTSKGIVSRHVVLAAAILKGGKGGQRHLGSNR
jgi:hypothetical protein